MGEILFNLKDFQTIKFVFFFNCLSLDIHRSEKKGNLNHCTCRQFIFGLTFWGKGAGLKFALKTLECFTLLSKVWAIVTVL